MAKNQNGRHTAPITGMVMEIMQDVDIITINISCENHLDTCIRLGGDSGPSRKGPSPTLSKALDRILDQNEGKYEFLTIIRPI